MNSKECVSCYEEFDQREGFPDLVVCQNCEPDPDAMPESRCPKCGWDCTSIDQTDEAPVVISNKQYNLYLAIEYGGTPYDWTETWTCPECSTEFSFENGS